MDVFEYEQRILSELVEAGAENICCLINTVFERNGTAAHVAVMRKALVDLLEKGFIEIAVEPDDRRRPIGLSNPDASAIITSIPDELVWKADDKHWTWRSKRTEPPFLGWDIPEVVITDPGREKAQQILLKRGEHWWGPR
jgi:hypothetical protein